mmetsp:Transcript_27203/g.51289  ORF Transcript_27203/g.51289 Transcript_27203/m.51289 type:complete len:322 (+) Transcript_27203:110-1075(+)
MAYMETVMNTMMAMKGKGGGKGWGGQGSWGGGNGWGGGGGSWGIEGLDEALSAALLPFEAIDPECASPQLVQKVSQKIQKAATKFQKDERINARGDSPSAAKVVIEEFCSAVMSAISASCYDKEWFTQVDLIDPLLLAVDYVFKGQKVCTRLVRPMMKNVVEEGVFRYREEERIEKVFWQAAETAEIVDTYRKKCVQALQKSYDEAFQKAPYGMFPTEPAATGLIQDFVYGWMSDFANRGHDILSNGVSDGSTEGQLNCFVILFQILCDPSSCCIPFDLVNLAGSVPEAPWPFIQEAGQTIYSEASAPPQKKFKGGKGFKF